MDEENTINIADLQWVESAIFDSWNKGKLSFNEAVNLIHSLEDENGK